MSCAAMIVIVPNRLFIAYVEIGVDSNVLCVYNSLLQMGYFYMNIEHHYNTMKEDKELRL